MTTTTYLWDTLSDNLLSEDDGTTQTNYTNEPSEFGDLVSQRQYSNTNFYHFDARGDTRELTDAAEDVTDTKLYDAWGNLVDSTGITAIPFQFVDALRSVCQELAMGQYSGWASGFVASGSADVAESGSVAD